MKLQDLNSWNGKTYNNSIYLSGQKIEDEKQIKKVKAFHIIKKNALDAIKDIREGRNNESSLMYLQGKYDKLIFEALKTGLIYFKNAFELDFVGYQFIISIYDALNHGKIYTIENTPEEIIKKENNLIL